MIPQNALKLTRIATFSRGIYSCGWLIETNVTGYEIE